jgi:hypothetical protein
MCLSAFDALTWLFLVGFPLQTLSEQFTFQGGFCLQTLLAIAFATCKSDVTAQLHSAFMIPALCRALP